MPTCAIVVLLYILAILAGVVLSVVAIKKDKAVMFSLSAAVVIFGLVAYPYYMHRYTTACYYNWKNPNDCATKT